MSDYRTTLNLPKTKFPMRGNLVSLEPKILMRWQKDGLYSIVRAAKKGKKIFVLHDGPPYANGGIHVGHSVNKILKDIIVKSKGFSSYDAPYVPGWDCHGLPIELQVEKLYGKPGQKISALEFRVKCREYAISQISGQCKDFIRLGVLGDWENPYLTMDFKTEANTIRALGKIISNGHFYRGAKPVHWCINCCSSLAEAEVEYCDKVSPSIYVIFKAVQQENFKQKFSLLAAKGPISLLIWTTTPWTLPANRALSLSSESNYSFVQTQDNVLIMGSDLVERVMECVSIKAYSILGTVHASELEMSFFKHPFLDITVPVVLSNHVILDSGTGVVHIAGSHGPDDYNVSVKYGLELTNLVDSKGVYFSKTHPLLDGVNIFKANEIIVEILRGYGALLHFEKIQHSYPYCWRHKTPIIFRATPQWFIGMDKKNLRELLLQEIREVQWVPYSSKARIEYMVANRSDWCISRQRTWGVPIALFVHKKTKELHPFTKELIEIIAKRVEVSGIQAWWDLDPCDLLGTEGDFYEKISDTLDVWFDSGSTHATVLSVRPEFEGNNVADIYVEGSDQHRGWFMSSLVISTAMTGSAPYRQVLTHGFTVDNLGRKMSKSSGNSISPMDVVNKFGADIFRLWVASIDYTNEIAVSDEHFKRVSQNYRRIRNTIRFLLANLHGFDPSQDIVQPSEMVVLDRWAVGCAKIVQEKILIAYESYHFHEVVQSLMNFCSIQMGSFYLDIIKDRQYTAKANSVARRSCQTALFHIIEAMVRWMAPILPFTADEIWSYLPGTREKYIFVGEWYDGLFGLEDTEYMNNAFWGELLKVRDEVNKIIEKGRTTKIVGSSLEAMITLYAGSKLSSKLISLGDELRFIFLTSNVRVLDYLNASPQAQQSECIRELKVALDKAEGRKCERCWHYTTDISQMGEEFTYICRRCINNITGNGEERKFV